MEEVSSKLKDLIVEICNEPTTKNNPDMVSALSELYRSLSNLF
ncbi:hypothetical protein [Floricoccus tropicus]|nr:hypothetical protein [Floricoccus tropicus]